MYISSDTCFFVRKLFSMGMITLSSVRWHPLSLSLFFVFFGAEIQMLKSWIGKLSPKSTSSRY